MATGQVRLGSDLERKKWMREGLVQSASKSFWSPLTGTTADSVVYQAKNVVPLYFAFFYSLLIECA